MSNHDWHTDAYPELRSGPPWVMQEMIAAQPAVIEGILGSPPAGIGEAGEAITGALAQSQPVVVCGCGTSEHAALGIAELIAASIGPRHGPLVQARPALTAALDPTPGVCLAVSHDGGTRATALALLAARTAGAETIAITQQPEGSVGQAADRVLVTPRHDDSWCHTVAYTSALAAGAALAAHLGPFTAAPSAARQVVEHATSSASPDAIAERLAGRRVLLSVGAQVDHITARELALKIAEGARQPSLGLELETVLHGQLAGHDSEDGLILVAVTDHPERERIARRAADVARAASAIGLPVAALLSDAYDALLPAGLTRAGRVLTRLPGADLLDPRLAGQLAGAASLQTLTLELAHARRTNPDLIRREESPYRDAAQAAEGSSDW